LLIINTDLVVTRIKTGDILIQIFKGRESTVVLGLSFAATVYGSLHLLAWNAPFSSEIRLYWRASSIVIASALFYAVVCLGFARLIATTEDGELPSWLTALNNTVGSWVIVPLSTLYSFAYGCSMLAVTLVNPMARMFLIVECFVNLTRLQDAVYKEPQWSQIIPHLGGH
jgi:hypothetical protein